MILLQTDRIRRLEEFEGEDTCLLVNVIQDSFGFEFTSDELVEADTVGRLADVISKRLPHPRSERCLSAIVFYRLRRAFIDLFESTRAQILPNTPLRELLPWTERRVGWRRFQRHTGLVLPNLTCPIWLLCLALAGSVAVAWLYALWFPGFIASGAVTGIVWFLAFFILAQISRPFARAFPRDCGTVGELVKVTLARNYSKIVEESGVSSRSEILLVLRHLIAVEIGGKVEDVSEETAFPGGLSIH